MDKSREHNINAPCSEFRRFFSINHRSWNIFLKTSPEMFSRFSFSDFSKKHRTCCERYEKVYNGGIELGYIAIYKGRCWRRFRKLFSIDKTLIHSSRIKLLILMTNRRQFYFLSIPMHSVAVQIRQILNALTAIYGAVDKRSAFMSFNLTRLGDSIFNLIGDMNLNNGLRNKEII